MMAGASAAVDVVSRGLAAFPGGVPDGTSHGHQPGRGSDVDCKRCKREKRPYPEWSWTTRYTSDPDVVRRHWPEGANVCVGCRANRLVVIDLDRHGEADGIEAFGALCESRGFAWPRTLTIRTPSGGSHLYYKVPPGRRLGNSAGRLAAGIDTRGPGDGNQGGYLVGPGSIVGGLAYEITSDAPIVVLPDWIADLLDPPRPPPRRPGPAPKVDDRYAAAALKSELDRLLAAPRGTRNDQLNASAYSLGQLVGAGVLDTVTAEVALLRAAESLGLVAEDGQRQAVATINSGLTSGMRKPRHLARQR